MSTFLRYLVSLAIHMTWSRMGKGGPVPPIRLPRKGPVNLPVLGPWQVMVGMWLMNKVWDRYGRELKTHLMNAGHPAARAAGSLLPHPKNGAAGADTATASTHTATIHTATPATVNVPRNSANGTPVGGAAQPTAVQPAPPVQSHKTQLLSDTQSPQPGNAQGSPSQQAPQGSILSSLRRGKSSNQPAQG